MIEQMSVYILGTEYAIKYLDSNSEPKMLKVFEEAKCM